MASSMTGFARSQALAAPYRLAWEVRSVNHRFLDATVRLPAELRPLEAGCRARVGAALELKVLAEQVREQAQNLE